MNKTKVQKKMQEELSISEDILQKIKIRAFSMINNDNEVLLNLNIHFHSAIGAIIQRITEWVALRMGILK